MLRSKARRSRNESFESGRRAMTRSSQVQVLYTIGLLIAVLPDHQFLAPSQLGAPQGIEKGELVVLLCMGLTFACLARAVDKLQSLE